MNARTEWACFFDSHAPQYEQNVFTRNTLAEVDFLIRELGISPGDPVLDVGCGTGRHSIELARRGFHPTGLDISPGMLDQARARAATAGVQVTWIEGDAACFDFGHRFAAAICLCEGAFGLLDRNQDPIGQPLAVLRSVSASLRPGAKCLFTVLNGYAFARRHTQDDVTKNVFDPLALTMQSDVCAPPHQTTFSLRERGFVPTELVLLFNEAGLRVLHIGGGTAGQWGHRPIDLDEIELMIVAERAQRKDDPTLPRAPRGNSDA